MHRRQFLSLLPAVPLLGRGNAYPGSRSPIDESSRQNRQVTGRPVVLMTSAGIAHPQLSNRCYQSIACPGDSARALHQLMTTQQLQDAVLVAAAADTAVSHYISQLGTERIAGLVLTQVTPDNLAVYQPLWARRPLPTLLTLDQHATMLPLRMTFESQHQPVSPALAHLQLAAVKPVAPVRSSPSPTAEPYGYSQAIERFVAQL